MIMETQNIPTRTFQQCCKEREKRFGWNSTKAVAIRPKAAFT